MQDRIHVKDITFSEDRTRATLHYSDGDAFDVKYEDSARALMTLVNGEKEIIRRDFALSV
jgi:hypothetical protein